MANYFVHHERALEQASQLLKSVGFESRDDRFLRLRGAIARELLEVRAEVATYYQDAASAEGLKVQARQIR
jgi:hypothetical protein